MLRRKIAALMRGRYGSYGGDKLGIFLILLSFVLTFAARFFRNGYVSLGIYFAGLALFGFYLFRIFSRNIPKRIKENSAFCSFYKKAGLWFKLQRDRIRDIKKYRYRKCRNCKAVLRLPPKRGKHTVVCPKCKSRMNVRNLF